MTKKIKDALKIFIFNNWNCFWRALCIFESAYDWSHFSSNEENPTCGTLLAFAYSTRNAFVSSLVTHNNYSSLGSRAKKNTN